MAKRKKLTKADAVLKELRAFGLGYPGAHTKSPWPGHLDLAVRDKTFAYLSIEGEPFGMSCKLPESCVAALTLPFAKPTAYGLGKSGWVSVSFPDGDIPVPMLKEWIDESYRAQAPKKLVASLGAPPSGNARPTARSAFPAGVPARVRPILEAAREVILEVAPRAHETACAMEKPRSKSMMWKLTRYTAGGEVVVSLGTFTEHASMFFARGTELEDADGLLEGTGKVLRYLTLRTPADARTAGARKVLREAFRKSRA